MDSAIEPSLHFAENTVCDEISYFRFFFTLLVLLTKILFQNLNKLCQLLIRLTGYIWYGSGSRVVESTIISEHLLATFISNITGSYSK